MKRRILIPIPKDEDEEPRSEAASKVFPISASKAHEARCFSTESMGLALFAMSPSQHGTVLDEVRLAALLNYWTSEDIHYTKSDENPILLFTNEDQYNAGNGSSWIDAEVCFAVMEVATMNPLGFYIRGGAQAPFHRPQVVVRQLAPSSAEREIATLHDSEGPKHDHGWLAFLAWRIAMTLGMKNQSEAGALFEVSASGPYSAFLPHGPLNGAPAAITLYTTDASGDSDDRVLNNAIWRPRGSPVPAAMSEDDPMPPAEAGQPKVLPPIYRERRSVLHIDLGGDFWVEETRCPECAQRLIIHTPASMCPSGRPVGLTVKCDDCKHSFGWP